MPRRTREQKVRAAKRQVVTRSAPAVTPPSEPKEYHFQTPPTSPIVTPADLSAIRKDLVKIAILTLLATAAQGGLYLFGLPAFAR